MVPSNIREPAVAGIFYPDDPLVLRDVINNFFMEQPESHPQGEIIGLIVPHAGYQYSGVTAATAYQLLRGHRFDTAVIVSPSHREYFDAISVYDGDAYKTPLGIVRINTALRQELIESDAAITASGKGHDAEHAIEVHLPFLQMTMHGITILPIVMGSQRRELCYQLGDKLAKVLANKNAILIASTDLSHYHPYHEAEAIDGTTISHLAAFEYDELMEKFERRKLEACGGGITVAVMHAARLLGATRVNILHHSNSGDVTGDRSAVVGYVAAAVLREH